jgi:hypothetical protein
MVQPADRDRIFVADLAAKSTGLSKANVMGLGRRATAHDTRLGRHELTVRLVPQANGLRSKAAADDRRHRGGRLETAEGLALLLQVFGTWVADSLRYPRAWFSPSIVASRSRKLASTLSASTGTRVFFAGRFLWTHSAASSVDLRSLSSVTSRSRSAFDLSPASTILGA